MLAEVCSVLRAPGYVLGNFAGWWLGEADDCKREPYVSVEWWDHGLRMAGSAGASTLVYDGAEPFHYCAPIVTQRSVESFSSHSESNSVLCDHPDTGTTQRLINGLRSAGLDVSIIIVESTFPESCEIISTLDLEALVFKKISKERYRQFQNSLRQYRSQNSFGYFFPQSCTALIFAQRKAWECSYFSYTKITHMPGT